MGRQPLGLGTDIREAETVKLTINGIAFTVQACPVRSSCHLFVGRKCMGIKPHKDCGMRKGITFKLEEEKSR